MMKHQTLMLVPLDVIDVANAAAEAMVSRAGEGENTFRAGNAATKGQLTYALACAYLTPDQLTQVEALAVQLDGYAVKLADVDGAEWTRHATLEEALAQLGMARVEHDA